MLRRVKKKKSLSFFSMHANKREEIQSVSTGDIAAVIAFASVHWGYSLRRGKSYIA